MTEHSCRPPNPQAVIVRKSLAWGYFAAATVLLVVPEPGAILGEAIVEEVGAADKLAHAATYLLLALAMGWAYVDVRAPIGRTRLAPLAMLLFAHALAAELTQLATPSREFDVFDLLAGWLGGALGVSLWAAIGAVGRRRNAGRDRVQPALAPAETAQQPCPRSD